MTLDRRQTMKLGTAAVIGAALPGTVGATTGDAGSQVMERLRSALTERELHESPALHVVSGQTAHNGGLRHDSDLAVLRPGQFVIQPCARVEDLQDNSRADVLPLFHECAGLQPADTDRDENARMMLALLTVEFGLAPDRLGFVSVPQSEVLRPVLTELGVDFDTRVFLRDREEAFTARDSSGYFFPLPGSSDHMVTVGVYYRLTEDGSQAIDSYPPAADWTEIGEIVIDGAETPVFSFGVERLGLATARAFPSADARLQDLFTHLDSAPAGLEVGPEIEKLR